MPHFRAFYASRADAEKGATAALASIQSAYLDASRADAAVASGNSAPTAAPTTTFEVVRVLPAGLDYDGWTSHKRVTFKITGPNGEPDFVDVTMLSSDGPTIGDVESHRVGDALEWHTRIAPHVGGRWSVDLFTLPEGS